MVFAACEETVVLDVEFESRLVINSFFDSESPWKIDVSMSNNILDGDTKIENVEDARVIIYDQDGTEIYELFHVADGVYSREDFGPSPTRGYSVQVTSGSKVATAYSYAPEKSTLKINSYEEVLQGKESGVEVDFQIEDRSRIEAYYIWEIVNLKNEVDPGTLGQGDQLSDDFFSSLVRETVVNTDVDREILGDGVFGDGTYSTIYNTFSGNKRSSSPIASGVLTDRQLDQSIGGNFIGKAPLIPAEQIGSLLTVLDGTDGDGNGSTGDGDVANVAYELRVMTISSHLYDYYKSVERSRSIANTSVANQRPIYSNVEGGLGIFAGFSESSIQF